MVKASSELQRSLQKISKQKEEVDRLSNLIGAEGGEVVAGLQQEIGAKTGELELVVGECSQLKDRAVLLEKSRDAAEERMVNASSELQRSLQKISKQKEEVDRLSNLIGAEGGEVVAGLEQEIGAKTGELELMVGECSQLKDRAVLLEKSRDAAEERMVDASSELQSSLQKISKQKEEVDRLSNLIGAEGGEVVAGLQQEIGAKTGELELMVGECSQLKDRAVLLEKSRDAAEERMVDASSELQSSLQKISKQKEEVDRLSNLIGAEGGEVVAGLQQEIGAKTGELELMVGECSQLKDRAVLLEKSRDAAEERMVVASSELQSSLQKISKQKEEVDRLSNLIGAEGGEVVAGLEQEIGAKTGELELMVGECSQLKDRAVLLEKSRDAAEERMVKASSELQRSLQKISKLKEEMDRLSNLIGAEGGEVVAGLQQEIGAKTGELELMVGECSQLKDRAVLLEKSRDAAEERMVDASSELQRSLQKISKQKEEVDRLSNLIGAEGGEVVAGLQQEIGAKTGELELMAGECSQLKDRAVLLEKSRDAAEERMVVASSELQSSLQKISKQKEEVDRLSNLIGAEGGEVVAGLQQEIGAKTGELELMVGECSQLKDRAVLLEKSRDAAEERMVDASSELQRSLQKISKQKEEVDRLSNLIGAEGGEVVAGLQQEIGAKTGELELMAGECSQLKDRAVLLEKSRDAAEERMVKASSELQRSLQKISKQKEEVDRLSNLIGAEGGEVVAGLQQEIGAKTGELELVVGECSQLKDRAVLLEKSRDAAEERMVVASSELQRSLQKISKQKEEVDRLSNLIGAEGGEVVAGLQQEIGAKTGELELMAGECSQLKDRAVLLEKSRDAAEERMVDASSELQSSLQKISKQKEEVDRLSNLIGAEGGEVVAGLQQEIGAKTGELELMVGECSQLKDRAVLLEKSRDAAEERMVKASSELQRSLQKISKQKEEMDRLSNLIGAEGGEVVAGLQQEIGAKTGELELMVGECSQLKDRAVLLEKSRDAAEERMVDASSELQRSLQKISKQKEEVDRLSNLIGAEGGEVVAGLQQEIGAKTGELELMAGECSQLKDRAVLLEKSRDAAEERMVVASSELQSSLQKISKQKEEVDRLSNLIGAEGGEVVAGLQQEIGAKTGELELMVGECSQLKDRAVLLEKSRDAAEERMVDASSELQRSLQKISKQKEEVDRLSNLIGAEGGEVVAGLQQEIGAKTGELELMAGECSQLKDRAVLLEKSRDAAEERMVEASSELQSSLQKISKQKEEVDRLSNLIGAEGGEVVAGLQQEIGAKTGELELMVGECSQLKDRAVLLEKSRDAAEERMVKASSELQRSLQKISKQKEEVDRLSNLIGAEGGEVVAGLQQEIGAKTGELELMAGECSQLKDRAVLLEKSRDAAEERMVVASSELQSSLQKISKQKEEVDRLSNLIGAEGGEVVAGLQQEIGAKTGELELMAGECSQLKDRAVLLEKSRDAAEERMVVASSELQSSLQKISKQKEEVDRLSNLIGAEGGEVVAGLQQEIGAKTGELELMVGECSQLKDRAVLLEKSRDAAEERMVVASSELQSSLQKISKQKEEVDRLSNLIGAEGGEVVAGLQQEIGAKTGELELMVGECSQLKDRAVLLEKSRDAAEERMVVASSELQSSLQKISKQKEEVDRLSNLIGAEGGEVVAGLQQEIGAKTGELELMVGECSQLKDRAVLLEKSRDAAEERMVRQAVSCREACRRSASRRKKWID